MFSAMSGWRPSCFPTFRTRSGSGSIRSIQRQDLASAWRVDRAAMSVDSVMPLDPWTTIRIGGPSMCEGGGAVAARAGGRAAPDGDEPSFDSTAGPAGAPYEVDRVILVCTA